MLQRMLWIIFFILTLWSFWFFYIHKKEAQNPYIPKPETVALSFIGGPSPQYTPEILKSLEENKINATFFVDVNTIQKYPSIIRNIYNQNHGIGCYGNLEYENKKLNLISLENKVLLCMAEIRKIIGIDPICFMPNVANLPPEVQKFIESKGLVVIYPDIDSGDLVATSPEEIVKNSLILLRPRSLIMFRDNSEQKPDRSMTVKATTIFIKDIRQMGLGFSRICYP